jgi:hypothetical protein
MTQPMQFQNAEHERVYRQLAEILKGLYGKSAAPDSRNIPQFWLRSGSADMLVAVMPAGEKNASIWLQAWVNVGAEPSREYYEFLLKANGNLRFGGFFLDDKGNCGYAYQFPASGLNEATLEWAINAIITTADDYDDQIGQRFGGKRPSDR